MRRCTRLLVPTLLAAAAVAPAFAADATAPETSTAASTPALVSQVADGATLVADWQKSLYGKVWNDQALADVRSDTAAELAKVQDELGFDPLAALAAMKGGSLVLTSIAAGADGKPQPHMQIGADVGDFAARIVKIIQSKSDKAKPVQVAGADEALSFTDPDSGNTVTLARFASRLSIGVNDAPVATNPVTTAARGDASVDVDLKAFMAAIISAMPADQAASFKAQVAGNPILQQGGSITYQAAMVPEGVHEGMDFVTTVKKATKAVDRDLLARLPGNALLTIAMGIDGKGLWAQNGKAWMAQAAQANNKQSGEDISADDMEKRLNDQIAKMGLSFTIADLVSSIDSSAVLEIGQASPFPTATIILPRSKQIDELVAFGLKQMGASAPAEGQSTLLPLPPGVPVVANLICDAKGWVITSDNDIAASWTGGQPGGWADSATGKVALAAADAAETKNGGKAYMIGASDTPGVLRSASGYLSMYLGTLKDMDPKQKQDVIKALGRLAAIANPGYLVCTAGDKGMDMDSRGLFGFIGIPVAAAAVATIRTADGGGAGAANEAAAVDTLKTAIFTGETQFQAKAYLDQDGNGVGEYGLLSELGGKRPVTKAIGDPLVNAEVAAGHFHGYDFAVFVPDAKGGALSEPDGDGARPVVAANAPAQEKHFVAYAWPEDDKAGKHMYAITEAGEVRQALYFSSPPAWGDLFDGNGWDSQAQWEPAGK